MKTLLSDTGAVRLASTLGMLGSAHDGEIAAAGRKADQFIRARGLTWRQLLLPGAKSDYAEIGDDRIQYLLDHLHLLTDWEASFVESVSRWDGELSPKQEAVIERLLRKIRRAA